MDEKKPHVCGAKTRSGGTCKRAPMVGGKRCRLHGQAGGRPIITGRWSKFVPRRLLSRLNEIEKDEDRVAMLEELSLVDVRISQLVEALDESGLSAKAWRHLATIVRRALADGTDLEGTLMAVAEFVDRGLAEAERWSELGDWIARRAKVVETEVRRRSAEQQTMTQREVAVFLANLEAMIRENVRDPEDRARLGRALMGYQSQRVGDPAVS